MQKDRHCPHLHDILCTIRSRTSVDKLNVHKWKVLVMLFKIVSWIEIEKNTDNWWAHMNTLQIQLEFTDHQRVILQ